MKLEKAMRAGLVVSFPVFMMVGAIDVRAASEKQAVSGETILSRLHSANLDEVALGQLAVKRGESTAVKNYAKSLVAEHNTADKQLLVLAKNKKVNLSTTGKGVTESIRTIKESVAYQNLKTLSGKNFDREFLKTIKEDHKKMIDDLESSEVSDNEIRKFADRQLTSLKGHLQNADAISVD